MTRNNQVTDAITKDELDCENGWDGKHQISGIDLPFGAYIYQMYYQDFDGWKHQESSEIIIIR